MGKKGSKLSLVVDITPLKDVIIGNTIDRMVAPLNDNYKIK